MSRDNTIPSAHTSLTVLERYKNLKRSLSQSEKKSQSSQKKWKFHHQGNQSRTRTTIHWIPLLTPLSGEEKIHHFYVLPDKPRDKYPAGNSCKPEIMEYQLFDGTLLKFNPIEDKFWQIPAGGNSLMPNYRLPKTANLLQQHQQANRFLYSALLYSTTVGTAATLS